jgi:hypothetical protein
MISPLFKISLSSLPLLRAFALFLPAMIMNAHIYSNYMIALGAVGPSQLHSWSWQCSAAAARGGLFRLTAALLLSNAL